MTEAPTRTWEDAVIIINEIAAIQEDTLANMSGFEYEPTYKWVLGRKDLVEAIIWIMKDESLTKAYLDKAKERENKK